MIFGLKHMGKLENVTWLSTSAWDPCVLFTVKKPVKKTF